MSLEKKFVHYKIIMGPGMFDGFYEKLLLLIVAIGLFCFGIGYLAGKYIPKYNVSVKVEKVEESK